MNKRLEILIDKFAGGVTREFARQIGLPEKGADKLNQWLRRDWNAFADALIDLGGDYRIGSINAYVDTTYFCDGIHLTNRGTEVVAGLISQGINQVAAK